MKCDCLRYANRVAPTSLAAQGPMDLKRMLIQIQSGRRDDAVSLFPMQVIIHTVRAPTSPLTLDQFM